MTYQPDWDIDREYGEQGEEILRGLLGSSAIEVKRKRRPDLKFYVETEQRPRGAESYKPSGIATTKAEHFAYVFADTGVVVVIPTELLSAACSVATRMAEETDSDNPTRGFLIEFGEVLATALRRKAA